MLATFIVDIFRKCVFIYYVMLERGKTLYKFFAISSTPKCLQVKLVDSSFCPASQYFQIYKALYRN